jgi:hypothetical protein
MRNRSLAGLGASRDNYRRGNRLHKILGRVWIASMISTAAVSFGIHGFDDGGLAPIHRLSTFVIIMAPLAGWYAYRGNIRGHSDAQHHHGRAVDRGRLHLSLGLVAWALPVWVQGRKSPLSWRAQRKTQGMRSPGFFRFARKDER